MPHNMLNIAKQYAAEWGWSLIPVHGIDKSGACTCSNPKCEHPGKHPAIFNGVNGASNDVEILEKNWRNQADLNLGLATGEESGVLVIDIDGPDAKAAWDSFGPCPDTLTVNTGKGIHLYFKHPAGKSFKNSVSGIAPHIDVRSNGGYVIVPPSRHYSGRTYEFVDPAQPIASPPDWLIKRLDALEGSRTTEGRERAKLSLLKMTEGVAEGQRNNSVTAFFGKLLSMHRHGLDPLIAKRATWAFNKTFCKPPLSAEEVDQIIESISKKELHKMTGKRG